MLLSHHQNASRNWDIKIGNILFENVPQFKYLGTRATNENLNQEEIIRRVNSDDEMGRGFSLNRREEERVCR
jgi:hypothetical protein